MADFLHVIKNFRSRVLYKTIYPLQSFKKQYLNGGLILKDTIIGEGTLIDLNSLWQIQDFYSIDLFSWGSFTQAICSRNWAANDYMTPFAFIEEARK